MANTLQSILTHAGLAIVPLRAVKTREQAVAFFKQLGYEIPPGAFGGALTRLSTQAGALIDDVRQLVEASGAEEIASAITDLFGSLDGTVDAIRELHDEIRAAGGNIPDIDDLPGRLTDFLILDFLDRQRPDVHTTLHLLGLIEHEPNPGPGQPMRLINWERLGQFLTEPSRIANDVYNWETDFDVDKFLRRMELTMRATALPGGIYPQTATSQAALGNTTAGLPELRLPILQKGLTAETYSQFGLTLSPAEAQNGKKKGIALLPYLIGTEAFNFEVCDRGELVFESTADIRGVGIVIRPPFDAEGLLGLTSAFSASVKIREKPAKAEEMILIGSSGGTRLSLQGLGIKWFVEGPPEKLDLGFEAEAQALRLVIASGEGDGFLKAILSGLNVQAEARFAVGMTLQSGFTFKGGTKLVLELGTYKNLGVVKIIGLRLTIAPTQDHVGLEAGAHLALNLGPLKAVVENLGLKAALEFRPGNIGVADLDLRFKPPSAIGLVVDASIVKGGGFLYIDEDRGEYFGALELKIGSINIKAIVILSTKVPHGWSLLMLIYSQFPPIQLSWGFTLNGVGGLIGVQHGMQIEELKTGMRTGALDDVLFPENPVVDAPRIINRLRVIFPATPRALVVGPMLELGWSTPTIMKIRMGLLFQIDNVFGGDRPASIKRIILIGQLLIQLPPEVGEEAVLLKLLVDFYGYYDFDINRLEFAARLRDSHVMKLPLSGMLFLRAEFGEKPTFILSAGGFHPNFKDLPADIPSPIDRLEIKFNIDIVEIRAQKYFAVTAASVQTGASIEVNASVGPVDISGWLGYDAIFYFKPRFFFEVDIRAGVLVKYRGHRLGGITLKLHLEGPGKWRARGSVTFSIFWWDIEKGFDVSWGKDPEIEQIKTNVSLLMEKALADKANWRAQLPQGGESVVTLQIAADETAVLAHPLGQLQVSQRVAPLDLELQRFGNTEVEGASKFSVTDLTVSGHQFTSDPALEFFARSHFVNMSDEEKLTSPSFEKFSSGVTVGSDDFSAPDEVIDADLEFETKYIDFTSSVPRVVNAGRVPLGISKAAFMAQMQHGAAAKSAIRSTHPLRPRTPRKIKLSEPGLQVASTDTQASTVELLGLSRVTSALAEQEARKVLGKDSLRLSHMVVEEYELSQ